MENFSDTSVGSERLMTAHEAAELLRVTPAWVYEQTRRSRMPHVRLGRYVRYRRTSLEAWVDENEQRSTQRPAT
jgi:excisionase family DNA binding protein